MCQKYLQATYVFPYHLIPRGASVILYGFGEVGQSYYSQIRSEKYCTLHQVVDAGTPSSTFYNGIVKVDKRESIDFTGSEYVVVAVVNDAIREEIVLWLEEKGIPSAQIIHEKPERSSILGTYHIYHQYKTGDAFDAHEKELIKTLHRAMHVTNTDGSDFIRVGADGDGGYIMKNIFRNPIAYSFGICDDVSWDAAMADKGFQVFQYDHTIQDLPYHRDEFHYFKLGVADDATDTEELKTLTTLIHQNDHDKEQHMILKMDVEGAEWGVLEHTDRHTLEQFDQIVLEFHEMMDFASMPRYIDCLKRLQETHALVHLHGNNFGHVLFINQKPLPGTMEALFIKKDLVKESVEVLHLPLLVDMPNDLSLTEIVLGNWNETNYYGL